MSSELHSIRLYTFFFYFQVSYILYIFLNLNSFHFYKFAFQISWVSNSLRISFNPPTSKIDFTRDAFAAALKKGETFFDTVDTIDAVDSAMSLSYVNECFFFDM